jgi:pyruvate dehydrogenase E2 component (dihydrolipoamide acetyltransferase)
MSRRDFRLPDLGEGLTEAEIVRWMVAVGDTVTLNQVIAEVETEKAVVELPSPYAGTVLALLVQPGTVAEVGSPIIAIDIGTASEEGTDPVGDRVSSNADAGAPLAEAKVPVLVGYGPTEAPRSRRHRRGTTPTPAAPVAISAGTTAPTTARPLASPPVRYMARVQGVDLAEVVGTGPDGIITREDVHAHAATMAGKAAPPPAAVVQDTTARETRTPVRGVRKYTAEAMVRSAFSAPHVTEFVTCDVTAMVELVATLRTHPAYAGIRVTPLTLVARAVLLALEEHPSLNTSWDAERQEIITKHYVNLGIAAATPRGLVVPNIKDAGRLRLRQLAEALADLADTAREGRSTPEDLRGGSFTITNIGVFGVDGGTPILNPGEAGIVCLGQVRRQPWEHQGEIALREVVTLSLSFDHRLVDGQEGSLFLASVATMLGDPSAMLALS